MSVGTIWHEFCIIMKLYRFGTSTCLIQDILIITEEDIRVVTIGVSNIREHICKVQTYPAGFTRLVYGNGSSFPYKNADGTMNERWVEIEPNDVKLEKLRNNKENKL